MEILRWKNIVATDEAFHLMRVQRGARNPVRTHGHDFAEVFWIDAGHATHIVNGQKIMLETGDLCFIRPGDVHSIEASTHVSTHQTLQLTNLAFARDVLDDFGARYFASGDFAWWTSDAQPRHEKISSDARARFNRWADEMGEAPREAFFLHRFLLNLLHQLRPRKAAHLDLQAAPPWLERACRAMEKPENLNAGLELFFQLAGRSREHTARSLKECCGVSPTEFVQNARLGRAARMLETSDDDILEIAFDCGFQNISHFYRLFKQRFGETPKAYRKRRQLF